MVAQRTTPSSRKLNWTIKEMVINNEDSKLAIVDRTFVTMTVIRMQKTKSNRNKAAVSEVNTGYDRLQRNEISG